MKTTTILVASILLFLLGAFGISHPSEAAMDQQQAERLYHTYYAQPHPELLPEAFEYFVRNVGEGDLGREVVSRLSARIRFFALTSAQNPDVIRRAEMLYPTATWPQKKALLDYFHYVQDDAATAALNQWAQNETDDERRLTIQKAISDRESPSSILLRILREDNLDEQWAAFYALGNSRVAEASMDWLSNTPPGQSSAWLPLTSRSKRFRQQVMSDMADNFRCPEIQAVVFTKAADMAQDQSKIFFKNLAEQILDFPLAAAAEADTYPADQLQPWVSRYYAGQLEEIFFRGATAVRRQQPEASAAALQALLNSSAPWAECLRGFSAYCALLARESAWQRTTAPAGGKNLLDACVQTLAGAQFFSFYETTRYQETGVGKEQTIKLDAAYAKTNNLRFYMILKPNFTEARLLRDDATFCWTDRVRKWTPIRERLSVELAEKMTSSQPLQELLQNVPSSIVKITAGDSNLAQASYENVDVLNLIPHLLNQVQAESARGQVYLTFDPTTSRILTLVIQATLYAREKDVEVEKAQADITRIYYDYDVPNLAWSQSVAQ